MRLAERAKQLCSALETELERTRRSREEVVERRTILRGRDARCACLRAPARGAQRADQPEAAGRPDMCLSSVPTVLLRLRRCTTESSMPWSSRNSDV